ncbi:tRNA uridine-5-carboxymethylaminomethyl(34) synthesis GTPase MnmE [Cardinium endosymbiont of Culicoides punctatus]|uniref:tRNA uridine-5-carboxymethylaminomethyl(34) synthesis GTPase MnmE n=1 Tax=Cardinium endosymbiont of Culicoides punctatus TaxID=2304601 RepID=UPI0010585635|nr:tRNA uridine-5-carboxymethylaminomethyl(34) synthesis GTPase MnmE [Cardinium endosymbiont of Culicoides punctatus]TDG94954.1 tRNA modification GTPase MnmE [Cardinium endosymbiont of Culicoides punctatus]
MYHSQDPIIALATPLGMSAIAVVRLSGKGVISMLNTVFRGNDLTKQASHTIHFGCIQKEDTMIDEVLVALFIAPHSFTKEDSVEISCHGSPFIVHQLIQLFIERGVRIAEPGEFTKRAFLNGRFDLTQAEAVADLISADSALAHQIALRQMRGGFASDLKALREELIHFAAMLELELDFSEENVECLDRTDLQALADKIIVAIRLLMESFSFGNVIKNGIPVVIAGKPNVGKSTLLNNLLHEERAIVSPIAGTTRDTIEGQLHLGGMLFRFIDTAGLRETVSDEIEAIGIDRTKQQLRKASVVFYLVDVSTTTLAEAEEELVALGLEGFPIIRIVNKVDIAISESTLESFVQKDYLPISARANSGTDKLKNELLQIVAGAQLDTTGTVVMNARHYERLQKSKQALEAVITGLKMKLSSELLASDIRTALHHLGEITGDITTEDILGEIFSKFCIGK